MARNNTVINDLSKEIINSDINISVWELYRNFCDLRYSSLGSLGTYERFVTFRLSKGTLRH